ncbi:COG4223 family protein [Frigidibacter oleivorans]|uniref:COG4223 family protein n=1 Tax=Frigidibacter oleivorans TaxID=2487129 RepID=UPI000F8C9F0F|nr:hypothetical protein [Frigidibacter oleivorans]
MKKPSETPPETEPQAAPDLQGPNPQGPGAQDAGPTTAAGAKRPRGRSKAAGREGTSDLTAPEAGAPDPAPTPAEEPVPNLTGDARVSDPLEDFPQPHEPAAMADADTVPADTVPASGPGPEAMALATESAPMPPAEEPAPPPADPPKARDDNPSPRRGGFLPALLGGVLAAALGAGAVIWLFPQGLRPVPQADMGPVEAQIAALSDEVAALRAAPQAEAAPEDLLTRIDQLSSDLAASRAAEGEALTRLQDIEARLGAVESGEGTTAAADPALQQQIDDLRAAIEGQSGLQDSVAAAAAAAEERIAAAEAEAQRLRAEAEETARAARARAALSHLRAALDSGAPLSPVTEELAAVGVTVPEPLSSRPDGVASLAGLQQDFPAAARAALAAALPVTAGEGWQARVGAFLQAQTGARSLTPQQGTGPDAVLSRAEAALAEGDLQAALTELQGLPPEGRAATAAWEADAQARLDALAAADSLAAEIG